MANIITTGDYKNCEIVLKENNPVLTCKKFLEKTEMPIDRTTIQSLNHTFWGANEHDIIIEWKDGKLSQAIVDDAIYAAIVDRVS